MAKVNWALDSPYPNIVELSEISRVEKKTVFTEFNNVGIRIAQ
jgi:hypothetical protein